MGPKGQGTSTYTTTRGRFTPERWPKGLRIGKLFVCTLVLWTAGPLHAQSPWMFDVLLGVSGSPNDGDFGPGLSLELSLLRRIGQATSALALDVGTLRAGEGPEFIIPNTGFNQNSLVQLDKRTRYLGGSYRFDSHVFDNKLFVRLGLGVARMDLSMRNTPFDANTGLITAMPFTTRISTWSAYGRVGLDVLVAALYEGLDLKVAGDSFILAGGEGVPVYFRVGLAFGFKF